MSNEHGYCPLCGMDFDGGLIWEHFYKEFTSGDGYWMDENGKYTDHRRILSHEEAETVSDEVARGYGATRTKGRWGLQIGISNGDSIYAYQCSGCNHTVDRDGWKNGRRSYQSTSDTLASRY